MVKMNTTQTIRESVRRLRLAGIDTNALKLDGFTIDAHELRNGVSVKRQLARFNEPMAYVANE